MVKIITAIKRLERLYFLVSARGKGFRLKARTEWSYSLYKQTEEMGKIVFNIYWNKKNHTYTVQTTINHRKGRHQLNRKSLTIHQTVQLLESPRQHTGKGYYNK